MNCLHAMPPQDEEEGTQAVDPAWVETSLCEEVLGHELALPVELKAASVDDVRNLFVFTISG